jgi:UDPglucose 6-dehydrogenase
MREAPSRVVIDSLLERGATVMAYDPVATQEARRIYSGESRVAFGESSLQVLEEADALIIVTEWKEFRSPDFGEIKRLLRQPLVFDGRNLYDPSLLRDAGLEYHSIGRR